MFEEHKVKEILQTLTSGKELSMERAESFQTTFSQEFNLSEGKVKIINLISRHLNSFQRRDSPEFSSEGSDNEEDPAANLKNEFNRGLMRFQSTFSVFRAAGLEDPNEIEKPEDLSDGSMQWNDSYDDDDNYTDFGLKPEEQKVFQKNFIRIAKTGAKKKMVFSRVLQRWRIKALQRDLRRERVITKIFFRFTRQTDLRMMRSLKTLRLMAKMQSQIMSEDQFEGRDLSLDNFEVVSRPSRKVVEVKREIRKVVTISRKKLPKHEDSADESPESDPEEASQARRKFDVQKEGLIGRPQRTLEDAMLEHVANRVIDLDPSVGKQFSVLNKVRYLRHVFERIRFKNRNSCFYTLVKINANRTRALGDVSARIKGKLLMAMHKNFSNDQVMHSYFRWYVKSNPDLLKKLATNLLIKLPLSNTVAAWRMLSLVRTHKQRDERAIMLKLARGLMSLMGTVRVHQFKDARNALQKMNPNHYTRKCRLLERTLVRLLRSKANKAREAFLRLRSLPVLAQKAYNKICSNLKVLKQQALDRLKFNALGLGDKRRVHGLHILRQFLKRKREAHQKEVFSRCKRLMEKKNRLVVQLMDKVGLLRRLAFRRLQSLAQSQRQESQVQSFNSVMEQMKRRFLLEKLGLKMDQAKRGTLHRLKRQAFELLQVADEEQRKKQKVARLLQASCTGRKFLALDKLKKQMRRGQRNQEIKSRTFTRGMDSVRNNLRKALAQLKDFRKEGQLIDRKKRRKGEWLASKLFASLQSNQRRRLGELGKAMRDERHNELKRNQRLARALAGQGLRELRDKREALETLRDFSKDLRKKEMMGNRIVRRLVQGNLRELAEALREIRKTGVSSLSKEDRQKRVASFMLNRLKSSLEWALYKLLINKNRENANLSQDKSARRGVLLGLLGNHREKLRQVLELLKRAREKQGDRMQQDKGTRSSLMRTFGQRLAFSKERLVRTLKKKIREERAREVARAVKRDGLLGLMLTQSKQRKGLAFYRLLFNRKREEAKERRRRALLRTLGERLDRKRVLTLRTIRVKTQLDRVREQQKERNTRLLANLVGDWSRGAQTVALMRLVRYKVESQIEDRNKQLMNQKLFRALNLGSGNKARWCLRRLAEHSQQGEREHERKQENLGRVALLLDNKTRSKKVLSLAILRSFLKDRKESQRRRRQLLRQLGQRLTRARNRTLWEMASRGQAQEMLESRRVMLKARLLNQMKDRTRSSLALALSHLMRNRERELFQTERRNKLRTALCYLLHKQAKFDKLRVVLTLAGVRSQVQGEEIKKKKKLRLLLEQLCSRNQILKFHLFHRLKDFRVRALKQSNGKKFLLETLGRELARTRDQVIFRLVQQKNRALMAEKRDWTRRNFALNVMKMKAGDKLNNAFYRLLIFGLKDNKTHRIKRMVQKKIFGAMISQRRFNLSDAFYRLMGFSNRLKTQFGNRKRMINLVNRTQTMKLRTALLRLKALPSKMEGALADLAKRKTIFRTFSLLLKGADIDKRRVLQTLRDFNDEERKRALLTGKGRTLNSEELARELQKRRLNPAPTGARRFFDEIKNYIRRHPKEGRNNELALLLETGEITDREGLFNYINGQRDQKGFGSVRRLLNSPNFVIDIFQREIPLRNTQGQGDAIKDFIGRNPSLTLESLISTLRKNDKEGESRDLLAGAKGLKKSGRVMEFLKLHNKGGKYTKVLRQAGGELPLKLSQIVELLQEPGPGREAAFEEARDFIDEKKDPAPLEKVLSCIVRKTRKGLEDELAKDLLDLDRPSLLEFVKRNKKKMGRPENKDLKDSINGRDDPLLVDFLYKARAFDGASHWLENDIAKLENVPDKRLSEAFSLLAKKKSPGSEHEFLLRLLRNRSLHEDLLDYLEHEEEMTDLNQALRGTKEGKAVLSNEELMARLRRVDLEDHKVVLGDSLDNVWDLLEKQLPGEKLLDLLRNSHYPRRYQHVLYKAKNSESPMDIASVYEELHRHRLLNPEVKAFINGDPSSNARLSPKLLLLEYIREFKHCVPGLQRVEGLIAERSVGVDDVAAIVETLQSENGQGQVQPALDFVDFGLKQSDMDRLRRFAFDNKDLDPGLRTLNDLLRQNPEMTLTEGLEVINEDPDEYSAGLVDNMLSGGDLDRPGHALETLSWVQKHNTHRQFDKLIEGARENLEDDGRDTLTEAIKRALQGEPHSANKRLLGHLNEMDYRNAFENMMEYIRANNSDGAFDPILEDLKKEPSPDLESLARVLSKHKGLTGVAELMDLLNAKTLKNTEILAWLKAHNSDSRYDPLIEALEQNPKMTREDLMRQVTELNPNGEMEDLLRFLNSEGHSGSLGGRDLLLNYLAKFRDDPRYKEAFDYLKKHGLEDPEAFLKYLESINHDGRYDEMIHRLKNMIRESEAAGQDHRNVFDSKLMKPLKKRLKAVLDRLRLWNQRKAFLDSVRDSKTLRLFMKLQLSSTCKAGLALTLLKNNSRGKLKEQVKKEKVVFRLFDGLAVKSNRNNLKDLARVLRRLERLRHRKFLGRLVARRIQRDMDSRKEAALGSLQSRLQLPKRKMELVTILLCRSLVDKKTMALKTLRDLVRDQRRMKMKSTLSNLYWNLRRNHMREKRHAFNIWSQKEFKLKVSAVADRLSKFVLKKKLKAYQHHKQLYYETKYKKLLDGNDLFKQFLEEKDRQHKEVIVESVFERKNPWIGRLLEALTRRVEINEQILLWRLVDEMNIEKTSMARATMLRSTMLNQM